VYRQLVRLIHPDRCPDQEMRRLADLQMMRLNGLLDTLSDPARRLAYDRSLRSHAPRAGHKYRPAHALPAAGLIVCAAIAFWPAHPPVAVAIAPLSKRAPAARPRSRQT